MDVVVLIGRILSAFMFLGSASGHLAQGRAMAGYARSRGVPLAKVAVPVTGVQLLVGGLMILLGVWADLGGCCWWRSCYPRPCHAWVLEGHRRAGPPDRDDADHEGHRARRCRVDAARYLRLRRRPGSDHHRAALLAGVTRRAVPPNTPPVATKKLLEAARVFGATVSRPEPRSRALCWPPRFSFCCRSPGGYPLHHAPIDRVNQGKQSPSFNKSESSRRKSLTRYPVAWCVVNHIDPSTGSTLAQETAMNHIVPRLGDLDVPGPFCLDCGEPLDAGNWLAFDDEICLPCRYLLRGLAETVPLPRSPANVQESQYVRT